MQDNLMTPRDYPHLQAAEWNSPFQTSSKKTSLGKGLASRDMTSRSSNKGDAIKENFQVSVDETGSNIGEPERADVTAAEAGHQSEQMSLLLKLVTRQGSLDDMEDVLPEPVNTEQQLLALCDRIFKEQTFNKQLVCITYILEYKYDEMYFIINSRDLLDLWRQIEFHTQTSMCME
ncbi:UNVERIFIED_CONTAM: hypothetical protein FKN15_051311 [Acipenser sinensis]